MDMSNECVLKKTEGKHDPGWNDPPTFSYNAQPAPGSKPRLSLNKRVAFPLNSSNAGNVNSTATIPQGPPFVPCAQIPTPFDNSPLVYGIPNLPGNTISPEAKACDIEKTELKSCGAANVEEVVGVLHSILEDNAELGNKIADIKRRIDVMKTMWLDGKLASSIQSSMLNLSQALQNADTKTADDIHKALMVDHIGSVSSWMVGIKQLILHCTAKNDLLSIDQD